MSSNGSRRRQSETSTTDNRGLSPLDISLQDLKRYRPRRSDEDDADRIHDPHSWDDPDPGTLERMTPDSVIGWIGSIAGLLIIAGLVAYLFPIFWPVMSNPLLVGGAMIAIYSAVIWIHGRKSGWDAFRRTTKSIIYLGDDLVARAGEQPQELAGDSAREYFVPFRSVKWGGFKIRRLLKRDLPYDPGRMRAKAPQTSGEDPVVDRLNATTEKIETESLGTILFTHGSRLDYDANAEHADRHIALPHVIDQGAVSDLHEMLTMLEVELRNQQTRIDMLLEANRELRDLKSAHRLPELEQAVDLVDRIGDKVLVGDRRGRSRSRDALSRIREAANGSSSGGER